MQSWTAPQVLDIETLGYSYDTIARPVFNAVPAPPAGGDVEPFGLDQPDFSPVAAVSDVVLADAQTLVLTGGDGGEGGAVDPALRWIVRFDGLRCQRPAATAYAVYLDLGEEQTADPSRLLGALSLFGVFESSLELNGDLGSTRLFDATAVVRGLPAFDPFAARLTLIPSHGDRDLTAVGLRVERISLEAG